MNSIEETRDGFEKSFKEGDFYNKQTQDEKHLNDILDMLDVKPGMKILDIGCGSGYLTFPIAERNPGVSVVGLDIITNALKQNSQRAKELGINNLEFVSYDGSIFPFEDESFDLIVTRYALHHFPDIKMSIGEMARVLKQNGRLFISDPRPNDCDTTRFVDDYMQLKKDGHVKFYTRDEWIDICQKCNMQLVNSFDSEIRFPKKKSTAKGYTDVLAKHNKSIIESYQMSETEDEIWITEQVNNLLFEKQKANTVDE